MESRERQPELMDAPGLAPEPHRRALRGLSRVNWISSTAATLWAAMRPYADAHSSLRVLDIGCGAGDVLSGLARRAARDGIRFEGIGCDISSTAIDHARELAQAALDRGSLPTPLRFIKLDCLRDEIPQDVDVAYCSLFLHHLAEDDAVALLQKLRSSVTRGILVDDLTRSRVGYGLAWFGTRIVTRSRIVHVDGPLSVKAAFTPVELKSLARRAGLEDIEITYHWPRRMLLRWSRK